MATIYSNNETVNINPTDELVLYKEEFINSRIEKFLYAICALDFDDLPTPLSRIEELYKCLATGLPAPTFVPQSRVEKYLMAILGSYDASDLPAPQSRTEVLLKKILMGDTDLSDIEWLKSRYEFLLAYIAKGGENDIAKPNYFVNYSLDNGFTTLYNTAEYAVKNAVLKGQTLVNLSIIKQFDSYIFGALNNSIKQNTKYIFIANVTNKQVNQLNSKYIYVDGTSGDDFELVRRGNEGKIITVFTTPTGKEINNMCIYAVESVDTKPLIADDMMIIEYQDGMENWDIPYFEGMQSVKMPVLTTTGKNLLPNIEYKNINNGDIDNITKGNVRLFNGVTYTCRVNDFSSTDGKYRLSFITFKNGKNISGTGEITSHTGFDLRFDLHARYQSLSRSDLFQFTFTANDDIELYMFTVNNSHVEIQIEDGSVATPYEPYKSNILTTNEEVELGGIGDVKDELNLITGELTERIGKIIYDGSDDEKWASIKMPLTPDNIGFYLPLENCLSNTDHNHMKLLVKDNLGFTKNCVSGSINDARLNGKNGFSIHSNGRVYFTTPLLECGGLTEWKAKLKQRPLILRYALKEKTVKTVDLSTLDQDGKETELSTFDDITHVTVSSEELVPTGEVTVATKDATDVIDAGIMSLRMDDISNSQRTLEESANAQSDDIDVTMLGTTDIYEQLL